MCLCSNSHTQGPLLHASLLEIELDSNHIPHLHLAGVVHYILWIHDVRQRGRGGDGVCARHAHRCTYHCTAGCSLEDWSLLSLCWGREAQHIHQSWMIHMAEGWGHSIGEGRATAHSRGEGRATAHGRGEGRATAHGRGGGRGHSTWQRRGEGPQHMAEERGGPQHMAEEGGGATAHGRGEGRGHSTWQRGGEGPQHMAEERGGATAHGRGEGRGYSKLFTSLLLCRCLHGVHLCWVGVSSA